MASKAGGWLSVLAALVVVGAIGSLFDENDATDDLGSSSVETGPSSVEPENSAAARDRDRRSGSSRRDNSPATRAPEPAHGRKAPANPKPTLWPVLRVIDGDTVEVAYRGRTESVRVIGIDTPETVDPSGPVECWGPRASAKAERFLAGERVRVRFDASQGRRDTYDRLLAYVAVPGRGDFGEWMIRSGHAAEYTYDAAYAHQGRYAAAEAAARAADRGLWAACGGVDTPPSSPSTPPPSSPRPFVGGTKCAPGYDPCVPPHPPDVDCADVDGPITVTGDDPHGLDGDGDNIVCES